jgi:hypothetical protein
MDSFTEAWISDVSHDEFQYYLQGNFGLFDTKESDYAPASLQIQQDETFSLFASSAEDGTENRTNVLLTDETQSLPSISNVHDNIALPSIRGIAKRAAPEENDSTIDASPAKKDRRGCHWKEKAKHGSIIPQPWQGNQFWSNKVKSCHAHD